MYTISPESTMPTTVQPIILMRMASSGHNCQVTTTKPISDSPAAHHSPVYSADMIFLPGLALTIEQPMMEPIIDTATSSSGYTTAVVPAAPISSAPSNMVAISVTT